jgi:heme/copper-type cytochrome/quinol oxidase subunit 1
MGILGKLLGTDTAVTNIISTVGKVVDDFHYSEGEKAEDKAKAVSEGRAMIVEWLQSTTGSRLARRIIALSFTFVFLLMHMISTVMVVTSGWVEAARATQLVTSSQVLDERLVSMTGAMMLILAFYFAAPHMGAIVQGAMKKFSGDKP